VTHTIGPIGFLAKSKSEKGMRLASSLVPKNSHDIRLTGTVMSSIPTIPENIDSDESDGEVQIHDIRRQSIEKVEEEKVKEKPKDLLDELDDLEEQLR